jgi:hypothetical protein
VGLKVAKLALEGLAAAADLDHEHAVGPQPACRLPNKPADEAEPVRPAVESDPRLPAELLRQAVHVRRRLIGRIA